MFRTAVLPAINVNQSVLFFVIQYEINVYARSQNCEKRLLGSSCLHVCLSVRPHGTTRLPLTDFHGIWYLFFRHIFMKCDIWLFFDRFLWNLISLLFGQILMEFDIYFFRQIFIVFRMWLFFSTKFSWNLISDYFFQQISRNLISNYFFNRFLWILISDYFFRQIFMEFDIIIISTDFHGICYLIIFSTDFNGIWYLFFSTYFRRIWYLIIFFDRFSWNLISDYFF
jgi:hypothetical protein